MCVTRYDWKTFSKAYEGLRNILNFLSVLFKNFHPFKILHTDRADSVRQMLKGIIRSLSMLLQDNNSN